VQPQGKERLDNLENHDRDNPKLEGYRVAKTRTAIPETPGRRFRA